MRDKPDFSVQRKSVANLLRDSDEYNTRLQDRADRREQERIERERRAKAEKKRQNPTWGPHKKVQPIELKEYKIIELRNQTALVQEGSKLNHCVGSYVNKCKSGNCSIWSLRKKRYNKKGVLDWYSQVTIELNKGNRIVQSSARFNASPSKEHKEIINKWASDNNI